MTVFDEVEWADDEVAGREMSAVLSAIEDGPDAQAFTLSQRRSWLESRGVRTYFGRHTERWRAWFTTAEFVYMDLGWFDSLEAMVVAAETALALHGTWDDMVKGAVAYCLSQQEGP